MPAEEIYQPRIMPQAAAPMPLSDPADFGAGLGQSIAQAGEQLHSQRVREFQIERRVNADREAADASHAFALHRQQMDDFEVQRQNGPIDGYSKDIAEKNEAARETILSGITEGSVRRQVEGQLDAYGTALHNRSTDWEQGQRTAKMVVDEAKTGDLGTARVYRDPSKWEEELTLAHARIGMLQAPETVKAKLLDAADKGLGLAALSSTVETRPLEAKAQMAAGVYNFLGAEVLDQYNRRADAGLRAQANAAARVASAVDAQFKDRLSAAKTNAGNGIDVSAELPELAAHFAAKGDQSAIAEIQGLDRDSRFSKAWNPATPPMRQARMVALQQIAPNKRTEDQQAELKWLTDASPALNRKFDGDPVGWAIQNGKPGEQPPALVEGNPATFAARAQWSHALEKSYGRMGLLSDVEKQGFRERLAQGAAGYSEVMNALAAFPGADARRAAAEVAPNDKPLQQIVLLPKDYRDMVIDGAAARKENPQLTVVKLPTPKATIAGFDIGVDRALRMVPVAERNGIREVARNIAAANMRRTGDTEMTPRLWEQAVSMALGGVGTGKFRRGGLGAWNDMTFLVPDGLTAQEFADQAFGFIKAHPDRGPVNPDGTPASIRNARPVFVGPGRYQFFMGDKAIMGRDHKPWQLTVGAR